MAYANPNKQQMRRGQDCPAEIPRYGGRKRCTECQCRAEEERSRVKHRRRKATA